MSDDDVTISQEEQVLGRLAELDLILAERIHAKAMAAEDVDEMNACARSYQRIARSVRQSLLAKARLARDRVAAARRIDLSLLEDFGAGLRPGRFRDDLDDDDEDFTDLPDEAAIDARIDAAFEAARPHLERERPDFGDADEVEVFSLLRGLSEIDDFMDVSMPVLVDRVLQTLGHPPVTPEPPDPDSLGSEACPAPPPEAPPAQNSA